jgi:hypothetical protein
MKTTHYNKIGTRGMAIALALTLSISFIGTAEAGEKRSWFQRAFSKPSWEQLLVEADTPEALCSLVSKHVGYREEDGDVWTAAEKTWEKGIGDCEDFALLVKTLCEIKGFDADIELYYTARPRMQGHAIVVGQHNGRKWLSSNGSFRRIDSDEDATRFVANLFFCKPNDIWTRDIAQSDIERLTAGSAAAPGVAASSLHTSAAGE